LKATLMMSETGARQLTFDLPTRTALGREDFFVSPANAAALQGIEAWQSWPQRRAVLTGPSGSGKTHLAHVWAALAGASVISAANLATDAVPSLVRQGAVCVEDADRGGDEAALFHLYNLCGAEGAGLLITGTGAPKDWPIALPDLASRLQSLPSLQLTAPDDALLQAVFLKQFADKQVIVSPNVVAFLAPRIERSSAELRRIVVELDAVALAERSPVTIPLARRVLDKTGAADT
jgi:chromosomal replication initiation ATPase DnaA